MPYATYRFNKIIAAETIRFIVTVAIVVYKGLKLVVYRMLTKNKLSRRNFTSSFSSYPIKIYKYCLVYYINFQQGIIPAGSYVTVPN